MFGYVYHFEVVGSPDAKGPPPGIDIEHILGETENVVLRLSNDLEDGQHKLFFGNLFSSPELLEFLKTKRQQSVATLTANLSRGCPIPTEKDFKKEGRGVMSQFFDERLGLIISAWYNNRRVLTILNCLEKDPLSDANRMTDHRGKK